MATRSKKSGGTPVPSGTGTSTPVQKRPSSPLSPTRQSRLQEKAELQHLNDRLACYIDRVRNLENENQRLTVEINSSREAITRETSNMKLIYDHELSDARKLLDETAKEKAKLEIDIKRVWEEKDEFKIRLEKKIKECTVAENTARLYESRYNELSGKYNNANSERKKALDDAKELQKENDRLRKQIDELRKSLEEETLSRVDLENAVQSLREELTFKDQIHSQELTETRTRRQVEINEIDGRLHEVYEAKLQQSLQELRDQYEGQMRANREEIEMLYDAKMKNLQNAANRNSATASSALDELRQARSRIDSLSSKIHEVEASNAALTSRIRDLEKILEIERQRHADDIAILERELQHLRNEMAQQLQEYQDLMDIKVSLDIEIAAYDKLLKGEESRLNIASSPTNTTQQSSISLRSGRATPLARNTPSQNTKRKRAFIDESEDRSMAEYSISSMSKGVLEIVEADPEGKFVKIRNKSKNEVQLGGYQVWRIAGKNDTVFKFHRSAKIDSGKLITIWSSDAPGAIQEPPSNIVMKQRKWFVADTMRTIILDPEGQNVAINERIKQNVSTHASKHRSTGSFSSLQQEELYHQQGDPRGEEKCRLM